MAKIKGIQSKEQLLSELKNILETLGGKKPDNQPYSLPRVLDLIGMSNLLMMLLKTQYGVPLEDDEGPGTNNLALIAELEKVSSNPLDYRKE